MTVKIMREDLSAAEPPGKAARSCGTDRQTLQGWAHRYNAGGPACPIDRPAMARGSGF
jgi:hypothetical protein